MLNEEIEQKPTEIKEELPENNNGSLKEFLPGIGAVPIITEEFK